MESPLHREKPLRPSNPGWFPLSCIAFGDPKSRLRRPLAFSGAQLRGPKRLEATTWQSIAVQEAKSEAQSIFVSDFSPSEPRFLQYLTVFLWVFLNSCKLHGRRFPGMKIRLKMLWHASKMLPRRSQDSPRGFQEALKTLQEAPKTLQRQPERLPKRFQTRPHGFQDIPRGSQEASRGFKRLLEAFTRLQNAPRRLQEGPKRVPNASQERLRNPNVEETLKNLTLDD